MVVVPAGVATASTGIEGSPWRQRDFEYLPYIKRKTYKTSSNRRHWGKVEIPPISRAVCKLPPGKFSKTGAGNGGGGRKFVLVLGSRPTSTQVPQLVDSGA
jgi:hypothetical protein